MGTMERLEAERLKAEDRIEESKQDGVSGDIGDTGAVGMSSRGGASGNSETRDGTGEPEDEVFSHVENDGSSESAW